MAVQFRDYYETLGVQRGASQDEIQRAYRGLARKLHPDVNKEAGADERFRAVAEAYEVLKDPQKRARYDELGQNWKAGQEFRPPPGWEKADFGRGRARTAGGASFDFDDIGGFSDFFETVFGDRFRVHSAGARPGRARPARPRAGETYEASVTIPLEDAFRGATRSVSLQSPDTGEVKTYNVKIPAGTADGAVMRLSGQGGEGAAGGPAGDLLLNVHVAPHPRFRLAGHDIEVTLPIAPWEAALGAKVDAPTLDGPVTLTIPPGSQSGQRLRLRGKGLPLRQGGGAGDLLVDLRIVVPTSLSSEEKALYEALRKGSTSDPRG